MLVLTRRVNQQIVFPTLGISVRVLKWAKGAASIGIEAPRNVPVLRDELTPSPRASDHEARHKLANVLGRATLAIHLAQKQIEVGQAATAQTTLEAALESLQSLEPATRQPADSPRRFHALIVEDDANERQLLAELLKMNGCKCDQVSDGEDALAYLEAGGRPDVVLLDMSLPRCDGPATLRRIRADKRYTGLKVFSVSSTSPRELDISDGPDGFDAWFSKPLNPRRLWDAIQESQKGGASSN